MDQRRWFQPNVKERLKRAEEKVQQAHNKYGCTWMFNALVPSERICSICGAKVHCPLCVPSGTPAPSTPIRYCVDHMMRGGRL